MNVLCKLLQLLGQEFQALFVSTTEPVDTEGNTTNPTKSPCDPLVFNTVLTRSKSLVVVVGSPVALLDIERHMGPLYGEKAHCWSNYMEMCLEKDTFIIPAEVEPDKKMKSMFRSELKDRIISIKSSDTSAPLSDPSLLSIAKTNSPPTKNVSVSLVSGLPEIVSSKASNNASPLYDTPTPGSLTGISLPPTKGVSVNMRTPAITTSKSLHAPSEASLPAPSITDLYELYYSDITFDPYLPRTSEKAAPPHCK